MPNCRYVQFASSNGPRMLVDAVNGAPSARKCPRRASRTGAAAEVEICATYRARSIAMMISRVTRK
jgi:hypothetical protein